MKYGISLKISPGIFLFYMKTGTGRFDWRISINDAHSYKTLNGALRQIERLEEMMGPDAYNAVHLVKMEETLVRCHPHVAISHVQAWK
jgi:hypothetical protein